ncbi:hypothetical protein F5H01DRAFT_206166 [Linnemannia elongata]|nr:hypothetical protein F5H01DRAFT_206166 [Linnemannia elongata]
MSLLSVYLSIYLFICLSVCLRFFFSCLLAIDNRKAVTMSNGKKRRGRSARTANTVRACAKLIVRTPSPLQNTITPPIQRIAMWAKAKKEYSHCAKLGNQTTDKQKCRMSE